MTNTTEVTCACGDKVMDLFERGHPVSGELWAQVKQEYAQAFSAYDLALRRVAINGGEPNPPLAFRTARAAEVMWCLRDYHTAEGCADILYATRLAGAPLNPAAAVA